MKAEARSEEVENDQETEEKEPEKRKKAPNGQMKRRKSENPKHGTGLIFLFLDFP